jgi:hypothetical protein
MHLFMAHELTTGAKWAVNRSKNQELSSTVVIGVREGGLYKLPGHIQALVHASVSPFELWHRRLGHLHLKALPGLQKMVRGMPTFQFDHDGICKGCVLGKNIKKSYNSAQGLQLGMKAYNSTQSHTTRHEAYNSTRRPTTRHKAYNWAQRPTTRHKGLHDASF